METDNYTSIDGMIAVSNGDITDILFRSPEIEDRYGRVEVNDAVFAAYGDVALATLDGEHDTPYTDFVQTVMDVADTAFYAWIGAGGEYGPRPDDVTVTLDGQDGPANYAAEPAAALLFGALHPDGELAVDEDFFTHTTDDLESEYVDEFYNVPLAEREWTRLTPDAVNGRQPDAETEGFDTLLPYDGYQTVLMSDGMDVSVQPQLVFKDGDSMMSAEFSVQPFNGEVSERQYMYELQQQLEAGDAASIQFNAANLLSYPNEPATPERLDFGSLPMALLAADGIQPKAYLHLAEHDTGYEITLHNDLNDEMTQLPQIVFLQQVPWLVDEIHVSETYTDLIEAQQQNMELMQQSLNPNGGTPPRDDRSMLGFQ